LRRSVKKEYKLFALKAAVWAGIALAVQFSTTVLLGGPIDYLVPGILVLGALQLGLLDRTALPGDGGTMLKRGVALLFITCAVWLGMGGAGENKIPWQPYSEAVMQAAREGRRPVIIDFTSQLCPPCHQMDRKVFSNQRVANAASDFIALRVDCTTLDAQKQALAEKFSIEAFPTIVFIGADGQERANLRLVGFEHATFFAERLESAR
jgi:thiol:disulfide interchange protein DsbD